LDIALHAPLDGGSIAFEPGESLDLIRGQEPPVERVASADDRLQSVEAWGDFAAEGILGSKIEPVSGGIGIGGGLWLGCRSRGFVCFFAIRFPLSFGHDEFPLSSSTVAGGWGAVWFLSG